MKKHISYALIIIISLTFIYVGNSLCKIPPNNKNPEEITYAEVVDIGIITEKKYRLGSNATGISQKNISFTAKITNGSQMNEIIKATQTIDGLYGIKAKEVEIGDKILVSYTNNPLDGAISWVFVEYNRTNALLYLCVAFLLLIVIIGRKKGFSTIISLTFTCATIFMVYIPSILKGYNIYASTIIISIFIIIMSLFIIAGINKKTLCAILGNVGGIAISGMIAIMMSKILNLTGIIDEHYVFLTKLNPENPLDLLGIIWGGIVIGSLGAIMDVAMSISSAMSELAEHMEDKSFFKMLKSGMNIGQDVIGTMTNTLILAYIGSSLAIVLLLIAYSKNITYLFSMEMIAVEIMQAVIGSIGILFAVPITAFFSAYFYNRPLVTKQLSLRTIMEPKNWRKKHENIENQKK